MSSEQSSRAEGGEPDDDGRRLSITEKTVRHHVEHIYDKLGVSTRAAAVVAAIGEGRLGDLVSRE